MTHTVRGGGRNGEKIRQLLADFIYVNLLWVTVRPLRI